MVSRNGWRWVSLETDSGVFIKRWNGQQEKKSISSNAADHLDCDHSQLFISYPAGSVGICLKKYPEPEWRNW